MSLHEEIKEIFNKNIGSHYKKPVLDAIEHDIICINNKYDINISAEYNNGTILISGIPTLAEQRLKKINYLKKKINDK